MAEITKKGETLFKTPLTIKAEQIAIGGDPKIEIGLFRNDECSRQGKFEIYVIFGGKRFVIDRGGEDDMKAMYEGLVKTLANGEKKLILTVSSDMFDISKDS